MAVVNIRAIPHEIELGGSVLLEITDSAYLTAGHTYKWTVDGGRLSNSNAPSPRWSVKGVAPGTYVASVTVTGPRSASDKGSTTLVVHPATALAVDDRGTLQVGLRRPESADTADEILWDAIRDRTEAISFDSYQTFIDELMLNQDPNGPNRDLKGEWSQLRYRGLDAYELLKRSTEAFLMQETGESIVGANGSSSGFHTSLDENARERLRDEYLIKLGQDLQFRSFPYYEVVLNGLGQLPLKPDRLIPPSNYGILRSAVAEPLLLELIWSYWMEEGMLVQTMNAITMRFQNRTTGPGDPLANFELDPLRPVSNIIWGWIQDEPNRLSVLRRAYEYVHHYGFSLFGQAVPHLRAADNRSKFVEAFHHLLRVCSDFYVDEDNTTIIADGFPVLNALKETHLILSYGAHNQYADLPWTARMEMLITQWILARPEVREFLGGRVMVPYPEPWMGRVDAMKSSQRWTDVSITHFRDLAVFGEQLLLSIRFGNWSTVVAADDAKNWARAWRSQIQAYTHAYRAATGVDLRGDAADVELSAEQHAQPSVHLLRRLQEQRGEIAAARSGRPVSATARRRGVQARQGQPQQVAQPTRVAQTELEP